ncbi:ABC transporter substrate-binding protein [Sphaerisporangium sp. TRM90804]|uniref:ABC transporter substrate-binding protein n=1 Tax=Sphaerisporangium sp. TRM90804 TaxID=3031113 RepID=UPI00244B6EC4|nr:ABC transporter substrate-binding protein [Sphaerisporangium sp. TRM90804]MDH2428990.1 ABC transporter substrate-binding protein [Sphaerisporangium sp. TRM90804]
MRRRTTLLASLALVALTACSGPRPVAGPQAPSSGTASPTAGGRLVYGLSADAAGFNPVTDQFSSQTYSMVGTMVETLVSVDASGAWKPNLAQSVTPNSAADEWTIKLRQGITFSDGTPLTGEVVLANFKAQQASPLTSSVFGPVLSAELADPMSVKVKLRQPWVAFPYHLAAQIGMVLAPASLADPDAAGRAPIGTGPFTLKQYVPDSRMVVTRNPTYWRKGLPYLDEIEFRILPDGQTRAQTLEAGGLDAMGTTRDEDVVKFGALKDSYTVHRPKGMAVAEYMFMLNTAAAPLDDVRVRRALAHATDRAAVIATVRSGLTEEADGPWSKDSPWYDAGGDYPGYDLARATSLVKEVEAEKGPIAFEVLSPPDPSTMAGVELAQDMWRKAGVDVTIRQADQADLINRAVVGDFQATVWTQFSSPDPDGEYVWLHKNYAQPVGSVALNFSRLRDVQLSDALDSGRSNPQPEVRKKDYATVQRRLRELVPFVFVDHLDVGSVIATTRVRGIVDQTLPDGDRRTPLTGAPVPYHPFTQVWVSAK